MHVYALFETITRIAPSTCLPSGVVNCRSNGSACVPSISGRSVLRRLDLGVAVRLLLDDRGVHAERHVVHEEASVDRRVVDPALIRRHETRTSTAAGRRGSARGRARSGCGSPRSHTRTAGRARRRSTRPAPASRPRRPCRGSRHRAPPRRGPAARGRAPWSSITVSTPSSAASARGRIARPCRRRTTGCTAGRDDAAGRPPRLLGSPRWRSRNIAAAAQAIVSAQQHEARSRCGRDPVARIERTNDGNRDDGKSGQHAGDRRSPVGACVR